MAYRFWDSSTWFNRPLCCRFSVARFGKVSIRVREGDAVKSSEWHWAIALFNDGGFEFFGAWPDDGPDCEQRIAFDLRNRGLERVDALAADDALAEALAGFGAKDSRRTVAVLAESAAFGPRMRRAIRWADEVTQVLQVRISRAVRNNGPFADHAAAADYVAMALQRADRDLFDERLERPKPAPYGRDAAALALRLAA